MWNFKCGTNEPMDKTEADVENRRVVAKGMGGKGMAGRLGLVDAKHLEWISDEVLLYSTGSCIQSLGIDHDGR